MAVCVLSVEELARWENHDLRPSCKAHQHISKADAIDLILDDLARPVGTGQHFPITSEKAARFHCIVAQDSNGRVWRGRKSGGCQVMQLVSVRPHN